MHSWVLPGPHTLFNPTQALDKGHPGMDASSTFAGQKPQRSSQQGHKGVRKESSWGQTTPMLRSPGITLTHLSVTMD